MEKPFAFTKTSTRASIASALAQSTSLPESKLDISAAIAFVSIYARDHVEGLIWGSDQRVLVLAGKLGKQLELEALVDLPIVYATCRYNILYKHVCVPAPMCDVPACADTWVKRYTTTTEPIATGADPGIYGHWHSLRAYEQSQNTAPMQGKQ
ncbi:CUE domain-containing protein [Mycena indigotica]|uniref:CUE domain-containing protein n=1 Tax=Mycena indigotica TaxID=2126181 RepID=A0A8H6WF29_9AGAR|nr:CUE domain-containing protein [Mycena indigotica]KAF7316334.1 CUE domain-containing protein [Mycena indigotica]